MPESIVNISNIIQAELGSFAKTASSVWQEVSRKPVKPSPQEEFHRFMGMPGEERQQLAQQMGPEAYMAHVQQMLRTGESILGPNIAGLEDYFTQDIQGLQPQVEEPGVETYNPSNLDSLIAEQLGQMGNHGGSAGQ